MLGGILVVEGELGSPADLELRGRTYVHHRQGEFGPVRWELPLPPLDEPAELRTDKGEVLARWSFREAPPEPPVAEPAPEAVPMTPSRNRGIEGLVWDQDPRTGGGATPAPEPPTRVQTDVRGSALQVLPSPSARIPGGTPATAPAEPAPRARTDAHGTVIKALPLGATQAPGGTPAATRPEPAPGVRTRMTPLEMARLPKGQGRVPVPAPGQVRPAPQDPLPRVTTRTQGGRMEAIPTPVPPRSTLPVPVAPPQSVPLPSPAQATPAPGGLRAGFAGAGAGTNVLRGPRGSRRVSLTFDGGSTAEVAQEVLDTLRQHGIQTTIFLTGDFIRRYPDLVRRMVREGHEVGNHTMTHPHMAPNYRRAPQWTRERVQAELLDADRAFLQVTGQPMAPLWRAPYGEHTQEIRQWAEELGYRHVGWSEGADTLDWATVKERRLYRTGNAILDRLKQRMARPDGDGLIVLMHLGSGRPEVDRPSRILGAFLEQARSEGWHFVKVGAFVRDQGLPEWRPEARLGLLKGRQGR